MKILIMGVSGSGKSTIGSILSKRLNYNFIEGDEFHSKENILQMKNGIPLTDKERDPWLNSIAERLKIAEIMNEDVIISCSALKSVYREKLYRACPDLVTIWLNIEASKAYARINKRKAHFMPSSLIQSQFDDLQPPDKAIKINSSLSIENIIRDILSEIKFYKNQDSINIK